MISDVQRRGFASQLSFEGEENGPMTWNGEGSCRMGRCLAMEKGTRSTSWWTRTLLPIRIPIGVDATVQNCLSVFRSIPLVDLEPVSARMPKKRYADRYLAF